MFPLILGSVVLVILLIWICQKYMMYVPIMGECVELYEESVNGGGIFVRHSQAVYVYIYCGKKYTFKEKNCFGSAKRKVGEFHKIYVKKKQPWKCITSEENTTAAYEFALGIILFLVGIVKCFS